ncbi:MAG TPA: efflux RND transporter periplasmic adaptor subunit [Puia sp.]|jgi:HlyD family secretion protein|nr:efflux RND transporter periplasmic adaptor subunit [Puia sp.]
MKKKSILIILVLLVAAAAVWFFFFRKKESAVALQTENPQIGYISQSVTATGNIQPTDTVTVGSQVSGIIKALFTDFNDKVKKGQLLAQLDKSLFLAQVDQNKANLLSAQSQLTYQQANFGRQELLYKTGAISKADYDNATYTLNNAKAQVENAKAQLASSEKNLSYTDIYSPMDGVVLTRNISVGQTVAASFNTPTFFTIAKDITKMQVQANVDEADIGNVAHGQRVTFTVDAFLDDVFQGSVEEIRLKPVTSANVVTYTTIINAPNDDQKLKPGMTANVTIYTKEIDSALLISAKALQFQPDSATLGGKYRIIPDTSAGRGRRGRMRKDDGQMTDTRSSSGPDSITGSKKFKKHDTTTSKVKDSSRVQASEVAHVWVLQDSTTLVQKKIRTGLNNDTQVQVLEGLTTSDVVVTGVEQVVKGAATPAAKSPFLPQRSRRPGGRGVR